MRIRAAAAMGVLAALLAACSTTGSVVTTDISVANTVTLQSPIDPEVATYASKFIAALERQGFKVGETENAHAMQLRLAFNGDPFDTRVAAELWHDGVPILTASATNSGWGTMLAHGAAVENLADSAVTIFEKKLSELRPHLRVVDEPSQQTKKSTTESI
jgi:hypothetical protein